MRNPRVIFAVCGLLGVHSSGALAQSPIDSAATPETAALFFNLRQLPQDRILFGHQHATETGHGWSGDPDRSDAKSVVGSHPAVIGVDFGGLSGFPPPEIEKTMASIRERIIEHYDRGGVITASWHMANPVTPESGFYWKESVSAAAVREILPGGTHHETYQKILQVAATLAQSVRGADGSLAPIIFRPFHEFDGNWFWWGLTHCTREEFIALWRFTVSYLRDELQVHNFLYGFSPAASYTTEAEFLDWYPGDAWVDLVGTDNYADLGHDERRDLELAGRRLKILADYAARTGKLAALTEAGLESIPDETWWTGSLLKVLKSGGLKLAYVLIWRNDQESKTHYYVPFPGHPSAPDFVRFYEDPFTLFVSDLPGLYRKN